MIKPHDRVRRPALLIVDMQNVAASSKGLGGLQRRSDTGWPQESVQNLRRPRRSPSAARPGRGGADLR
jgi:hypothetical protein